MSLKVYGQVNRMLLNVDDGRDNRLFHADNDMSSTRVGFKGKAETGGGWSAGTTVEMQVESNSSSKVTLDQEDNHGGVDDEVTFTERKLEVWFKNRQLGKISFGQGSTASDGTIEEDLSGTGVITGAGIAATGGDVQFVGAGLERDTSDRRVDKIFDNMDGLGREDRLRYDSPTFGGFPDLGLLSRRYVGWREGHGRRPGRGAPLRPRVRRLRGRRRRFALGGERQDQRPRRLALRPGALGHELHAFPPSMETDGDTHEPTFGYVKPGQELDLTPAGRTAVSVSFGSTDDQGDSGDSSGSYYDLAVVQKIKGLGTELYALYGVYDADIMATPTDEITVTGIGARIKF